ncbi:MAG: hypothetical protein ACK56I_18045, partial [bacterium]
MHRERLRGGGTDDNRPKKVLGFKLQNGEQLRIDSSFPYLSWITGIDSDGKGCHGASGLNGL